MSRLGHLLTDTVTVAAKSGVSGYGDPSYGAQAEVDARVEYDRKVISGPDGTELVTTHVIASSTTEIALGSRVWLPGADTDEAVEAKLVVYVKAASIPDGSDTIYEARV